MTIRNAIKVVTTLAERRTIANYAITGAVAALLYIEPTVTEVLDILVSIEGFEKRPSGLLLLNPIETALAEMGYTARTDLGFWIDGWPVQFLPVASSLDEEALAQAVEVNVAADGEPPLLARALRAEHLVAIALKVGRSKDLMRIQAFLANGVLNSNRLKSILERHNLLPEWKAFCFRGAVKDPLAE